MIAIPLTGVSYETEKVGDGVEDDKLLRFSFDDKVDPVAFSLHESGPGCFSDFQITLVNCWKNFERRPFVETFKKGGPVNHRWSTVYGRVQTKTGVICRIDGA